LSSIFIEDCVDLRPRTADAGSRREKESYHHGDLRKALIEAALILIEEKGVKGFTLKDAARMAGVSTAAPYRHFADKEALLGAILAQGFAAFNQALRTAFESVTEPREKILELGVAYIHFALNNPAQFRVMFGLNRRRAEAAFPSEREEGASGFELLGEGLRALDPLATPEQHRDRVLACWSIVHGFVMLHLEGAMSAMVDVRDLEGQMRRTVGLMIAG